MITLHLELPLGTPRTLVVKGSHEITLQDWKNLTPIVDKEEDYKDPLLDVGRDIDRTYRILEIFTGLSQKELDKLRTEYIHQILAIIGEHLALAQQGSDEFQEAIAKDSDWTPSSRLTIGDTTFMVPQDLKRDIVLGQWVDWSAWTPPQHEADLVAEALLFMLVEEGKEYGSFGQEKVDIIMQCPKMAAFELCAFFFAKSDSFRSITAQRSRSFHMWTRHMLSMALKISRSSIEDSTSLLKPERSTTS